MGMKQVRCKFCNKRRRKAEPWNTRPDKQWLYVRARAGDTPYWMCHICVVTYEGRLNYDIQVK